MQRQSNALRILYILLLLASTQAKSADTACASGVVKLEIEGNNNQIVNVGNRNCFQNSALFIFSEKDFPDSKGHIDISDSLVWRADIIPKRISYKDLFPYIDKLNKEENSRVWRLPLFEELYEFSKVIKTKENKHISRFSTLEVWAEPEDGEPAFYNIELRNKYSGAKFEKKRYLLLVSSDFK